MSRELYCTKYSELVRAVSIYSLSDGSGRGLSGGNKNKTSFLAHIGKTIFSTYFAYISTEILQIFGKKNLFSNVRGQNSVLSN